MLFNSYAFIFAFFPVVFVGFYLLGQRSHALSCLWLAAVSLFFYGWWDVHFVGILLGSLIFNYAAGYFIGHQVARQSAGDSPGSLKMLLICAVAVNLAVLGYFKYANFFVENLNHLTGVTLASSQIILPLGISFFTFTQIAFLVDTYQGKVKEYNFVHYIMFVTYFPHLIAGPVLHHKEMMPQFARRNVCHLNWTNIAVGLTIFAMGLTKKVLIADSLADFSVPIFSALAGGGRPMLLEAWIGALSYTLQLYFDFSAYSDMAIGLSLMFNVRLPVNFNSPYKATSIIEFWRCWHMTLSRFLLNYLYIPLGGSHKGKARRYFNLVMTMLLGGLWHGAGWTFVVWGGLHGFYLIVNHAWRSLREQRAWGDGGSLEKLTAGLVTFIAVVVGWVFFRADSFSSATAMLYGMAGMNGMSLPGSLEVRLSHYFPHQNWILFEGITLLSKVSSSNALFVLLVGFVITWCTPNIREIFGAYHPTCENAHPDNSSVTAASQSAVLPLRMQSGLRYEWKPLTAFAWITGVIFALSLMGLSHVSEFLYFQF